MYRLPEFTAGGLFFASANEKGRSQYAEQPPGLKMVSRDQMLLSPGVTDCRHALDFDELEHLFRRAEHAKRCMTDEFDPVTFARCTFERKEPLPVCWPNLSGF